MTNEDVQKIIYEKILSRMRALVRIEDGKVIHVENIPEALNDLMNGFGESMREIADMILVDKNFKDANEDQVKMILDLKKLSESMISTKHEGVGNLSLALIDVVKFTNLAAEENLSMLPSMKKGLKLEEVLREAESRGSLLNYYDHYLSVKENLDHMETAWMGNAFFLPRMPILSKAMSAHLRTEFEVSTPIFLIHIEAFFEFLFHGIKLNTEKKRKLLDEVVENEAASSKTTIVFLKSSIFLSLTNDIMRKITMDEETFFPNRHKILHGENLNYWKDKMNSTKCLIVLDSLSGINIELYREKILSKINS